MKKILTGIRSTGTPHLGNILGVIIPTIKIINKNKKNTSFIFIADLHSLIEKEKNIKENAYNIISTWLSFGLNTKNCIFYRQSDIPEVTELAWYFSCFFSYKRLMLSHSFKEKIKKNNKKKSINLGLFTYPILMAADILLYDADTIPIGKDQIQHIEITRRIANFFNKKFKQELFVIPNYFIQKKTMLVPGIDGKKMSKSKKNWINIFSSNNEIKKKILKIQTDSKSLKDKKNPDKDYIISLYKLVASPEEFNNIKKKYLKGGFGYLDAKMSLYKCINKKFSSERKKFFYYMNKKELLEELLTSGAKKAKYIALKKLDEIRKFLNFNRKI